MCVSILSQMPTVVAVYSFQRPPFLCMRCKAQHVLSGEAHYFREWHDLTAYLRGMTMRAEQTTNAEPDALIKVGRPGDAGEDSV